MNFLDFVLANADSGPTELEQLRAELARAREAESAAIARAERLEAAVAPFIPKQFVDLLGKADFTELQLGDEVERKLTILFLDIRGFTALAEEMSPAETFTFVNSFLSTLEPEVEKHRGFVDKYIGDSIMALFPGSQGSPAGAEDAIAGANGMLEALAKFNEQRISDGKPAVRVGIGLNTGPAIIGTVGGKDRMETTVLSDAVNLASRLESATKVYGVPLLISEATLYALGKLAGPTTRYVDRIRVKGKTQPQSVYEVFDSDPEELRSAKTRTRAKFEEAVAFYHMKDVERALPLFKECLAEAPEDQPAKVYMDRCNLFLTEGKHETTGELVGTVAWRNEFTLGVDAIDAQHHELLDAINRLVPCLSSGDRAGLLDALDFLESYAKEHFGLEYRLMAKHRYTFMYEHLREHRSFSEHFDKIRAELEAGQHETQFMVFLVQIFLVDWFANHSTGTDRHLAKYLKRLWDGRSRSPGEELEDENDEEEKESDVPPRKWDATLRRASIIPRN